MADSSSLNGLAEGDNVNVVDGKYIEDPDAAQGGENPTQENLGEAESEGASHHQEVVNVSEHGGEFNAVRVVERKRRGGIMSTVESELQEYPQVGFYTLAILLMMVAFYLSSPIFAVFGGALLVMTGLHYGG